MESLPVVRHFLACQRFVSDFAVREVSLIQVLYQVYLPTGVHAALLREVHLFAQLSDGADEIGLTVDVVRLDDESVVARADEVRVTLTDRLAVYNFHRVLARVPIGPAGMYEFRLYARNLDESTQPRFELLACEPLRVEDQ